MKRRKGEAQEQTDNSRADQVSSTKQLPHGVEGSLPAEIIKPRRKRRMRDPFTGQYMTAEEQAHEEALIAKEAAEFWQGFSERLSA
jgi:hypothetical protein